MQRTYRIHVLTWQSFLYSLPVHFCTETKRRSSWRKASETRCFEAPWQPPLFSSYPQLRSFPRPVHEGLICWRYAGVGSETGSQKRNHCTCLRAQHPHVWGVLHGDQQHPPGDAEHLVGTPVCHSYHWSCAGLCGGTGRPNYARAL